VSPEEAILVTNEFASIPVETIAPCESLVNNSPSDNCKSVISIPLSNTTGNPVELKNLKEAPSYITSTISNPFSSI